MFTGPGAFSATSLDVPRVVRRFYQLFRDDYDSLNILANPSFPLNRGHFSVRNDVQGIGLTSFDRTADYGSQGRLMGISTFPTSSFFDGAETGYQYNFFSRRAEEKREVPFHSSLSAVTAKVGGLGSQTIFAGAQEDFVGLDQINLKLSRDLAGRGEAPIAPMVDEKVANVVTVRIK